ncbi:zinc ribbon domain-containing protein [Peptoclostridium sp.]|uniref:zinc ribbon domain-containing protein n=1 Tax=Peptoclostridium sp. TaxID=1904860 RepID=UPI003FA698FE
MCRKYLHSRDSAHKARNPKLSNWSFGKLQIYLEYKLDAKGISMSKINESYTTQICLPVGNTCWLMARNSQFRALV